MKVLDLGSGAGDVALLLADLVGPQGRVVGVDADEAVLAVARERIRAAGWSTVSLRSGDEQLARLVPPDWPGVRCLTDTVRSLLPFLTRVGAVTPAQIDIDTLEERLRAEVVDGDRIQLLPPLVGAWTRL
jgi:SAM-dependent methyltransferase